MSATRKRMRCLSRGQALECFGTEDEADEGLLKAIPRDDSDPALFVAVPDRVPTQLDSG